MNKTKYIYLSLAFLALVSSCKKSNEEPQAEDKMPVITGKPYISQIFEFNPAPGQFTNSPGTGTLLGAQALIGGTDGLLSLGAYGGNIIFGFDHSVANAEGADLGIYGNPIIGSFSLSEPGIVCVMQDKNGNGLPDDGEWLELAGSEYSKPSTLKNYQITYYKPVNSADDIKWTDNQGKTGYILKNKFHSQEFYPVTASATISFTGTLLPNTLTNENTVENLAFDFGYADNGSLAYGKLQAEKGKGYNEFDIDWAVDKNGKKVALSYINFVKVYTGQNCNGNPTDPDTSDPRSRMMGEISTEISGARDLHIAIN